MASDQYTSWILILCLFFLMCGHGNGVRDVKEENILLLPQSKAAASHENHMHAHPFSHMDHLEAIKKGLFFTTNDLYKGKIMYTMFHVKDPSSASHFLSKEEADSIPFSYSQLPQILDLFSIPPDSPQGKAMKDTLSKCRSGPIEREAKMCATSLESMLDFVRSMFGFESNFKVLMANHPTLSTSFLQNYTISEVPKQISASKMIGCHTMPYAYAVFYCHTQKTETKVFRVSLVGESGDRVETTAVCHMDTSDWNPTHASFQVLGVKPGTIPVCHFFPSQDLVWVRLSN